jgi:hypothetical protein
MRPVRGRCGGVKEMSMKIFLSKIWRWPWIIVTLLNLYIFGFFANMLIFDLLLLSDALAGSLTGNYIAAFFGCI